MTTARAHAPLGMRSQGDFDKMWKDIEPVMPDKLSLADQPLSLVYAETEPQIEWIEGEEEDWLTVEFPGMRLNDFSVDLQGQVLTLKGDRAEDISAEFSPSQGRPNRAFARRFVLEKPVKEEAMTITSSDGALAVCLPKAATQLTNQPELQMA